MLIYVVGVAGSGKSTLRGELERRGSRAKDADESLCACFDADGNQVPTLALGLRTPEWYASHFFRMLLDRLGTFAEACADGLGFVLGLASNDEEIARYFHRRFFLTADTDVILERLRARDGDAHATRFAAFASVEEWKQFGEQRWLKQGYTSLKSVGTPVEIAGELLGLLSQS